MSDATLPSWKRLPVPAPTAGDGCQASLVVNAQGDAGSEPVLGRFEIYRREVVVSTVSVASGKRVQYKGRLDESICDQSDPKYPRDVVGTVRATAKSELRLSVARNDYFSRDRERLCLTMTDVKTGGLELTLCETSKARLPLRDAYQKALKTSDDIEVVLEGRDRTPRTLLVGSLDLQARRVTLSELSKSPLALLRHSEPGPACETHECHLELSAFEVTPELTVLVVVTAGESCGAKCSQFAEGQIWTLDREGFRRGADLPATDEMPGGLTYGGRISHTNLCWTEADGAPPLEILVAASESGKEETNLSVVGFDPATRTYSFTEAQPPVRGDAYQTYCGSPLAEF